MLFDVGPRTDRRPHRYSEPVSRFLDRSGRGAFDQVRRTMNDWFSHYCQEDRAGLYAALRSDEDKKVLASFWELYLHESLRRAFTRVECHPTLPDIRRHPDFRAAGADSTLLVEARLAWEPEHQTAGAARLGRLYDAIDRMDCPDFLLDVDINGEGPREPNLGYLRSHLSRWLATLDADTELRRGQVGQESARTDWSDAGWELSVEAFPLRPEHRGLHDHRPLGSFTAGGGQLDGVTPVRRALQDKSRAYGDLREPFIIALRTDRQTDMSAVTSALFGTVAQPCRKPTVRCPPAVGASRGS